MVGIHNNKISRIRLLFLESFWNVKMKNKTIKNLKKKGGKIAKKAAKNPLVKEYFKKQKKLTKETLKKVVKSAEKSIDNILK